MLWKLVRKYLGKNNTANTQNFVGLIQKKVPIHSGALVGSPVTYLKTRLAQWIVESSWTQLWHFEDKIRDYFISVKPSDSDNWFSTLFDDKLEDTKLPTNTDLNAVRITQTYY